MHFVGLFFLQLRIIRFTLRPFYRIETAVSTCLLGGWMGFRSGFDTEIQRKISALVCNRTPIVSSLSAYGRQNRTKTDPNRSNADENLYSSSLLIV